MKFSHFFRLAADVYLSERTDGEDSNKSTFSCCAVAEAIGASVTDHNGYTDFDEKQQRLDPALYFLKEMGCDTGSFHAFDDVPQDVRQAARYAWLHFAADYAEELGQ